jgi:hypothetical protein
MATPIAPATFVLTDAERGPSWLLDLSGDPARTAFIPEAVDE